MLLLFLSVTVLVLVVLTYTKNYMRRKLKLIQIPNGHATSHLPGVSVTESLQKDVPVAVRSCKEHLGSFIDTIELPDAPGINSPYERVQLRCSDAVETNETNAGGVAIAINGTNSVGHRNTFVFPPVGFSDASTQLNQSVAHV